MHLVGFIIRIYHDARSPERQILITFTYFIAVYCIFIKVYNSSMANMWLYCKTRNRCRIYLGNFRTVYNWNTEKGMARRQKDAPTVIS